MKIPKQSSEFREGVIAVLREALSVSITSYDMRLSTGEVEVTVGLSLDGIEFASASTKFEVPDRPFTENG